MSTWTQPTITALLDLAESSLRECVTNLALPATILRKERAVGIIPSVPGYKFARESLEETVLVVQKKLEMSEVGKKLPFCAFNGGNDVFVDIGDKSWGVLVCQKYFGSPATGNNYLLFHFSFELTSFAQVQARKRMEVSGAIGRYMWEINS
jgi:IMP and pyridine-specific 5'-nucleotidase